MKILHDIINAVAILAVLGLPLIFGVFGAKDTERRERECMALTGQTQLQCHVAIYQHDVNN